MQLRTTIIIAALVLSCAGCGGTAVHNQIAGADPLSQRATDSPPRVGTQFQPEIAQLAAEGLRLKEAVEASLDGNARHLAAIFEGAKASEPTGAFEFRILESDGRRSKTIFRRSDFFFTFSVSDEVSALNATDINGDGLKEVIVQSSSGGNCWSCNPIEIYHVKDHKGELIAAGPFQKIADLNADGVAELLVADARWEVYDDLSHAAAPAATMIYTWRGDKYVYASRDFAAFYKGEIDRLRASLDRAKADITADEFSDEEYVGLAISLAITYAHLGDAERGLNEMESLLKSNVRSAGQSKRRAKIVLDFRQGESATKLREVKYGDPIPLG